MQDNGGFVDLRVGHGARAVAEDSVWPSFTDIMTVIVMIFLMALVIMMARNIELDRQLVTTTSDKEASLLENRGLTEQLATVMAARGRLSRELAALSDQFSTLKLRSDRQAQALRTANLSLAEQLDTVASQLEQVSALLQKEQQQRRELGVRVEVQSRELLAKQDLLDRLRLLQQQTAQRHADASTEIDELNELIRQRQAENAELQKLAEASGARFRSLQDEYEALDARYRDLARPARSPAGKYVVDVRIIKSADEYRYQLKEPAQRAPVDYTRAELTHRLAALKEQRGNRLYTRVVIPENNQLSHNEAWRFTREILLDYDYYYQQNPDALGISPVLQ